MGLSPVSDYLAIPALADFLESRVRTLIASALTDAMRGRSIESIKSLSRTDWDRSAADVAGRAAAQVFVLHLDRQAQPALKLLNEQVLPNLFALPEEVRIIVEQNHFEILWGAGLPAEADVERHYSLVDRRKLLGIRFRDSETLLEAAENSKEGKNYNSLPVYSAGLFASYRQFNWRDIREFSKYLCNESLTIGAAEQAVFYAVLSEDKQAAASVATHSRAVNDPALTDKVIQKLAEVAQLARHRTLACHLLSRLGDAIPDSHISTWLSILRTDRVLSGTTLVEAWAMEPAWEATTELLKGANPDEAGAVVDEILAHPRWKAHDLLRMDYYKPLKVAASRAAESTLIKIAEAVIPHVTVKPAGHDLGKAITLLLRLAARSADIKKMIVDRVFVGEQHLSPLLLIMAQEFGIERQFFIEDPAKVVHNAINQLQSQVERREDGGIAVKFRSGEQELHGIASYAKEIPADLLDELVESIIAVIQDPKNVNVNRIMLFSVLAWLANAVSVASACKIVEVSASYSGNHREKGHPLFGQPEQHSPLNAFRIGNGWPQDARGQALLALAEISKHHPTIAEIPLRRLLLAGMTDSNAVVRQFSYHASVIAGPFASHCMPNLVGGTQDSDPKAANVALQAVGVHAQAIALAGLVPSVLGIIESQVRHPDASVRFAAATVVKQLRDVVIGDDKVRLDAISSVFSRDISRRVRTAIA